MRDDNGKWAPALGFDRPALSLPGFAMTLVRPDRQTLISGPVQKALALASVPDATGWPGPAIGAAYAVRLRRDRILVVDGPALADGWHGDPGVAVSDMTDGYCVIEISGSNALEVLRRGTEISPEEPSASVARGFSGYGTLIYALETEDRYRIHVARSFLEGLWALLETHSDLSMFWRTS